MSPEPGVPFPAGWVLLAFISHMAGEEDSEAWGAGSAAPIAAPSRSRGSSITGRVQLQGGTGGTISPATVSAPPHQLLCYSHEHLKEQQQQPQQKKRITRSKRFSQTNAIQGHCVRLKRRLNAALRLHTPGTARENGRDGAGCHQTAATELLASQGTLLSSQPCCPQRFQPHHPQAPAADELEDEQRGSKRWGCPEMWLSSVRWLRGNRGRGLLTKSQSKVRGESGPAVSPICPSVCSRGVGVTLTPKNPQLSQGQPGDQGQQRLPQPRSPSELVSREIFAALTHKRERKHTSLQPRPACHPASKRRGE